MNLLSFKDREVQCHKVGMGLWGLVFTIFFALITSASGSRAIESKLDSIVIPQVNFSGMELTRVIETLSELSVEYDPDRLGVNIVPFFNPNEIDPKVNISMSKLSLRRILGFVTKQVGATYTVGNDYVAISIKGSSRNSVVVDPFAAPPEGSELVDPFAAPADEAKAALDFFGPNLLQEKEDLKACAASILRVLPEDSPGATEQDLINGNALALLAHSIINTVLWQSVMSEEGELTTLQVTDKELDLAMLSTRLLQETEEISGSEDLHPSWIVFSLLLEEGYISWRYAEDAQVAVDESNAPEELTADDPEALLEQSPALRLLQKLGISWLTLLYILIGTLSGALIAIASKSRTKPVVRADDTLPQKPRPISDSGIRKH